MRYSSSALILADIEEQARSNATNDLIENLKTKEKHYTTALYCLSGLLGMSVAFNIMLYLHIATH